jgi:hypothetical protein
LLSILSCRRALPGAPIACGGLLVLFLGTGAVQAAADTQTAPSLEKLLRGMDRASFLYLDTALRFACTETIVESGINTKRVHRFAYLFIYDKEHGFQDYRTLRQGKDRRPVNPSEKGVGLFLERAYMWVLLFNRTRQPKYRYEILDLETIDGVATAAVRFEPIPPYQEGLNDWIGTAWVDPSTYQIVKVEAMKVADFKASTQMQKDASEVHPLPEQGPKHHGPGNPQTMPMLEGPGRSYRIEQVTTKFSVLKNGMRFPGEVKLTSTLYYLSKRPEDNRPDEASRIESKQSYTKYSFYAVRTSDEVRRILSSDARPPKPPH